MNPLKKAAHKLCQLFGRDFMLYNYNNFVDLRRQKVFSANNITLVLDVGANKGTYVREIRSADFSGKVVSFEPLPLPYKILQQQASKDHLWNCENSAIGNSDGKILMNVSGHETSSSLLSMTQTHVDVMPCSATVAEESVQIARLDSFYSKYVKADDRICLKVDVQGYEKEVLKGAIKILAHTHVIEIELSTIPMYEDAPVLTEMTAALDEMGYTLVSIAPVFSDPQTGYLLQADGIFVRREADKLLN